MRRLPLALTPALAALALAAPAGAATATTSPAPLAPTTPATPAPAPAGGTLRLSWVAPIVVRGHRLALSGRPLVVRGRVSNYVAGQRVVVKAYRNGRRFLLTSVAVQGVGGGRGGFAL